MQISKAIEILTPLTKPDVLYNNPDTKQAIKLGIEALEFLEKWRSKAEIQPFPLLRSETLE